MLYDKTTENDNILSPQASSILSPSEANNANTLAYLTKLIAEEHSRHQKKARIVCWGDSLTAGGGWIEVLAQLGDIEVYNAGAGGETARTIMARQGADVMTVNNITIPAACEPVTIAKRATDKGINTEQGYIVTPLLRGSDQHVNPVMINDIEGTLTWTGKDHKDTTGSWIFTRNKPGKEFVIDRPTAIRTYYDRMFDGQNDIMIVFMGANGGYRNVSELVDMHKKMIDHFKGKEYIILGFSHGTASQQINYEETMKQAFGRRFISLREYLSTPVYDENNNIVSCYGLADQGLEPSQKEYDGKTFNSLEEIATGTVPHQLLVDGVHYTSGTKQAIGKMLYKKMRDLNILP